MSILPDLKIAMGRAFRRYTGFDLNAALTAGRGLPRHLPDSFRHQVDRHRAYTMVSWQGLFFTWQAVRHVIRQSVPGAIVECGVWRGGCVRLMAETLAEAGDIARDFWLFDTFAGMTEPTSADRRSSGLDARLKWRETQRQDHNEWCYASRPDVELALRNCNYPFERFHFVEGDVLRTIPSRAPAEIALLRLDTDWYESTRHELEYLWPRLAIGGVVILDDYGTWEGARKAADEFFVSFPESALVQEPFSGAGLLVKKS
ncbi:MAG: macrocin O-methyltransferase [Alphaproteobacteria bacterium]|nr:macrocin O-methyltransferase [Alphaproteobacteria bacterium]